MKKVITLFSLLFLISLASAGPCHPEINLINQDPYPAVPGDYVKLVFQLEGLDAPECRDSTLELLEDYPIKFNPGENGIRTVGDVSYIKDYESNVLVPYEVVIDSNALDGANPIEVKFQARGESAILETFEVEVDDTKAEFEIYVKNYNYDAHALTIEILNIADSDIEALTVEIPKQENIQIKGSNRMVVGDLDSNEYTTAEFEATLTDGDITLNLIYSDSINVRRETTLKTFFDSSYFKDRKSSSGGTSFWTYLLWIIILVAVVYYFIRKRRMKKIHLKHHH